MFLKQLLHLFIEMKSTFGPTMKKISFFLHKGRAYNCGLHIQFFDRINICFKLLEQLLHLFNEMQSTFGPIMKKLGGFFWYRGRSFFI
jgi:hypothetical protein